LQSLIGFIAIGLVSVEPVVDEFYSR